MNTPTYTPVEVGYISKVLGVSLVYPVGWEINEDEDLVIFSPPIQSLGHNNKTGPALWIGTVPPDTTIADLAAEFSSDSEVMNEGHISISSKEWAMAQIIFKDENQTEDVVATICLTHVNGQNHILVAVAPAPEWNTYQPLFQEVVNSFHFDTPIAQGIETTPSPTPTPLFDIRNANRYSTYSSSPHRVGDALEGKYAVYVFDKLIGFLTLKDGRYSYTRYDDEEYTKSATDAIYFGRYPNGSFDTKYYGSIHQDTLLEDEDTYLLMYVMFNADETDRNKDDTEMYSLAETRYFVLSSFAKRKEISLQFIEAVFVEWHIFKPWD